MSESQAKQSDEFFGIQAGRPHELLHTEGLGDAFDFGDFGRSHRDLFQTPYVKVRFSPELGDYEFLVTTSGFNRYTERIRVVLSAQQIQSINKMTELLYAPYLEVRRNSLSENHPHSFAEAVGRTPTVTMPSGFTFEQDRCDPAVFTFCGRGSSGILQETYRTRDQIDLKKGQVLKHGEFRIGPVDSGEIEKFNLKERLFPRLEGVIIKRAVVGNFFGQVAVQTMDLSFGGVDFRYHNYVPRQFGGKEPTSFHLGDGRVEKIVRSSPDPWCVVPHEGKEGVAESMFYVEWQDKLVRFMSDFADRIKSDGIKPFLEYRGDCPPPYRRWIQDERARVARILRWRGCDDHWFEEAENHYSSQGRSRKKGEEPTFSGKLAYREHLLRLGFGDQVIRSTLSIAEKKRAEHDKALLWGFGAI